jgi:hypothetical protein
MYINFSTINFQQQFDVPISTAAGSKVRNHVRRWNIGSNLTQVMDICIQSVPGGKLDILGGHIIGHPEQKSVYVHVYYSERFPR